MCTFIIPISRFASPVRAYFMWEFRVKTWDRKRSWKFTTPINACRSCHMFIALQIYMIQYPKNSITPPKDHTNPKKSLAWYSAKCPWSLREMPCLPVKCDVYPRKRASPFHPQNICGSCVCLTNLVTRMPTNSTTGLCSDTSPMVSFAFKIEFEGIEGKTPALMQTYKWLSEN